MEVKNKLKKCKGQIASSMVLLGVGAIILVVVLGVIFSFLSTTALNIQSSNESIAITSTSNTVINETIAISSATGNTDNISVISVTFFGNGTNNTDSSTVSFSTDVNWSVEGEIRVNSVIFSDGDYNISYVYTEDAVGNTANEDVTSTTYFGNRTTSTDSTGIALDSEVNVTRAGLVTVKSLNFSDASYDIVYEFEPSAFVESGTARTLIALIPVLAALAILLFVLGFVAMKGK